MEIRSRCSKVLAGEVGPAYAGGENPPRVEATGMALRMTIYSTLDGYPSIDELLEALEEYEFDATIECEEDEEEEWEDLYVFESSIEGAIEISRSDQRNEIVSALNGTRTSVERFCTNGSREQILQVFDNCVMIFEIEIPEELVNDDNALLLGSLLAQTLAARTDGIYCVDSEGYFDELGELLFERAAE